MPVEKDKLITDLRAELGAARARIAELEALLEDREATVFESVMREREAAKRSTHDYLTDLLNRRGMDEAVKRILSQITPPTAKRKREEGAVQHVAVMYLDIDHFKDINDKHGHPLGDKVLKAVAAQLDDGLIFGHALRESDLVVRLGGEEFAVIFPGTSEDKLLEKLALPGQDDIPLRDRRLRKLLVEFQDQKVRIQLTLSAGITEYRYPENFADTLERADAALYAAKKLGRNRIVVAP